MHDRLADLLARRMAAAGHPPDEPISVAELHRELLPYPVCRESLGLATKGEYDLAVLRLLNDPRRLEIEEPELKAAVEEELSDAEPGLAFLGDFAPVSLRPRNGGASHRVADPGTADDTASGAGADTEAELEGPDAGHTLDAPPDANGDRELAAEDSPAPDTIAPDPGDAAFLSELSGETSETPTSARCRSCRRALPERPDVRFCPHCGTDQRVPRCGGCDAELESGWEYCPSCGRRVERPDTG